MVKRLLVTLLFFVLISVNISFAAVVHGDVYDINFNKINNAIVEINSVPKQSIIVKDSGYSFKINPGNYTIKAYYISNQELRDYTQENLLVKDSNGDYNLDLILFPYLDQNTSDLDIKIIDLGNAQENKNFPILLLILSVISLLVIAYLIIGFRNTAKKSSEMQQHLDKIKAQEEKQEPEETSKDVYYEKTYSIIKEQKRVNQKDLRKELNVSEAKISLVITQLESEGKVKRIKKGRGNLIIFLK
jgi:uncharacterized membrane protein